MATAALEQSNPELLFQTSNLMTERRLADRHAPRRPMEVRLLGDCHEVG
jgi:hypothetical protein